METQGNPWGMNADKRDEWAEGRAGRRLLPIGDLVDPEETASIDSPRCTSIDVVSLHAKVAVPARDGRRRERLCRYVARPPLSSQRLSRLEDGVGVVEDIDLLDCGPSRESRLSPR